MLLCAAMLIFSAGYLWLTGTDTEALIWVAAVWVCALTGYLAQDYVRKKRRWTQTEKMMSQLKEKYLYTELMPAPENEMERMYFECSRSDAGAYRRGGARQQGIQRVYRKLDP